MTEDYWVFQTEDVVFAKFVVIAIIHACLGFIVLEGGIRQNRKSLFFVPVQLFTALAPLLYHRVIVAIGAGICVAFISALLVQATTVGTMMIANAAFLTLWYVECAILLARGFFRRLFDDEIPSEITLFISFVVMVNAGYFTLMFLVSILRAPSF